MIMLDECFKYRKNTRLSFNFVDVGHACIILNSLLQDAAPGGSSQVIVGTPTSLYNQLLPPGRPNRSIASLQVNSLRLRDYIPKFLTWSPEKGPL